MNRIDFAKKSRWLFETAKNFFLLYKTKFLAHWSNYRKVFEPSMNKSIG